MGHSGHNGALVPVTCTWSPGLYISGGLEPSRREARILSLAALACMQSLSRMSQQTLGRTYGLGQLPPVAARIPRGNSGKGGDQLADIVYFIRKGTASRAPKHVNAPQASFTRMIFDFPLNLDVIL